jgi:pimeloyl-ACP methyl ester carboxylesterase
MGRNILEAQNVSFKIQTPLYVVGFALAFICVCRTVAIDMRGYGESEKPSGVENYSMHYLAEDVKQVVEALGLYAT